MINYFSLDMVMHISKVKWAYPTINLVYRKKTPALLDGKVGISHI